MSYHHSANLSKCSGEIFSFPHHKTWEFTSDHPVRSVFPLWPVYGLPMIVLRWVWTETGKEEVAPKIVYYTMRILMFILSFVLEDWAIHELVQSPRQRRLAVILVASSYVTWTYQTHMFSNSIETLVVAWSLVMIQRILDNKVLRVPHLYPFRAKINSPSAPLLYRILRPSRLPPHLRHLYPHHLPRLSHRPRAVPAPPLPPQTLLTPCAHPHHRYRHRPRHSNRHELLRPPQPLEHNRPSDPVAPHHHPLKLPPLQHFQV